MDQTGRANDDEMLMELTAEVVAAYVGNNQLERAELAALIADVHGALARSHAAPQKAPEPERPVPAVPIRKSVTEEFIVCLEDGKKFKSLKRHLATRYDLTPDAYRAKWGLPHDYPMVAPSYAAQRSALALAAGLGRKPKAAAVPESKKPEPVAPKRRAPRKAKAAA